MYNYLFLCALRISDGQLLFVDVLGSEVEYLPDTHTTPRHEIQHDTVSHLCGSKDDLINRFFLQDIPLNGFPTPEEFL